MVWLLEILPFKYKERMQSCRENTLSYDWPSCQNIWWRDIILFHLRYILHFITLLFLSSFPRCPRIPFEVTLSRTSSNIAGSKIRYFRVHHFIFRDRYRLSLWRKQCFLRLHKQIRSRFVRGSEYYFLTMKLALKCVI